jgi:hypothetical protein
MQAQANGPARFAFHVACHARRGNGVDGPEWTIEDGSGGPPIAFSSRQLGHDLELLQAIDFEATWCASSANGNGG